MRAVAADTGAPAILKTMMGLDIPRKDPRLKHGPGLAVGRSLSETGGDTDDGGAVERGGALPQDAAVVVESHDEISEEIRKRGGEPPPLDGIRRVGPGSASVESKDGAGCRPAQLVRQGSGGGRARSGDPGIPRPIRPDGPHRPPGQRAGAGCRCGRYRCRGAGNTRAIKRRDQKRPELPLNSSCPQLAPNVNRSRSNRQYI